MQRLRAKVKGDRAARRASRQRLLAAKAGEQGASKGTVSHRRPEFVLMLTLTVPTSSTTAQPALHLTPA